MKKVFATVCLALLLSFSLYACGGTSGAGGDANAGGSSAKLGSTIGYPTTFMLDGVVYTYPIDNIEVFEANGWVVDEEYSGYTLIRGDRQTINYYKGDAHIEVMFVNESDTDLPLSECPMAITLSARTLDGIEVVLAGEIAYGSTKDDFFSLYGEPDLDVVGRDGVSAAYIYEFTSDDTESNYPKEITIYVNVDENNIVDYFHLAFD